MRKLTYLLPLALLAACESAKVEDAEFEPRVLFGQPFPQCAADQAEFPTRMQGTYLAVRDTTLQLCINAHTVWAQRIGRTVMSQQEVAKEKPEMRVFDTWRTVAGMRYYLRHRADDSVAGIMVMPDTLFHLQPGGAWHLRRFQGACYLSRLDSPRWRVRRLVLADNTLRLEKVGLDTLRLAILPPDMLVRPHDSIGYDWLLRPANRKQTKLVTQSAGLWETLGEYQRR